MTGTGADDEQILEDEFGRLAGWTADAIEEMDLDDPVPAACNGSGSPSSLAWLAEHTGLRPGSLAVDTGAGLGGPAAWMARRTGASVVTAEPMIPAATGARRLFGGPGAAAWSHQLPFRTGTFSAALALAVLSTVEDKEAYLAEVRRVLRPGGRLGLLDYVRTAAHLVDPPANNDFLTADGLDSLIGSCGYHIVSTAMAAELPPAPDSWSAVADRVARRVAEAHPGAAAIAESEEQQGRFARLMSEGALSIRLLAAVRN